MRTTPRLASGILAALLSACGVGGLNELKTPVVKGSLAGFQITYDGSDDPGRCVGTSSSITADEDGQAMSGEPGHEVQQCDSAGPGETCGHSHPACLTPTFSLTGMVDDAASTTIHVHDGQTAWTITVQRGGTAELLGAPTDGGPLQVGQALAVRCSPASGTVIGAHLDYMDIGAEQQVATSDVSVDGGVVSFTLSNEQLLDDETRNVQVICDIAYEPSVCDGPASCVLTGPLRGASVPMFFPQL